MRRRARGSDCSQSRSRAAEHSALQETPMTDPSDKMCKHWPYPANVFLLSFACTSIIHIAQYYVLHDVCFCWHWTPSRPRVTARHGTVPALIDAGKPGRKSSRNLRLSSIRRQANRTPEPVTDRALGTRKRPARDDAGHTL